MWSEYGVGSTSVLILGSGIWEDNWIMIHKASKYFAYEYPRRDQKEMLDMHWGAAYSKQCLVTCIEWLQQTCWAGASFIEIHPYSPLNEAEESYGKISYIFPGFSLTWNQPMCPWTAYRACWIFGWSWSEGQVCNYQMSSTGFQVSVWMHYRALINTMFTSSSWI